MTSRERSATGDLPTILIVGGGFSGAVLAWHLHRAAPYTHNIIIIEPRDEIGAASPMTVTIRRTVSTCPR